jgi:hypothetical protein
MMWLAAVSRCATRAHKCALPHHHTHTHTCTHAHTLLKYGEPPQAILSEKPHLEHASESPDRFHYLEGSCRVEARRDLVQEERL